MTKIFVYGTLKKNHANNFYLDDSEFISSTNTKEKYVMYTCKNHIPYVVSNKEKIYQINGELYDVDMRTLDEIDDLEGNGKWYTRKLVELDNGDWAYCYFNDTIDISSGEYTISLTGMYTEESYIST
mmetsp:Transcript_13274/g.17728  ORF Transcript_13274/g.17728 Transcript_13274/m.17728 type:complete len:127 (+) Transcript_13274:3-383(+)